MRMVSIAKIGASSFIQVNDITPGSMSTFKGPKMSQDHEDPYHVPRIICTFKGPETPQVISYKVALLCQSNI